MFLKRFAAIVIALVLLVQLTACRDEAVHTSTNDPHQNTSLQTESTTQNADDANQDNSKDEDKNDNKDAASSGITSSGDNKKSSSSQQTVSKDDTVSDDKQEVGGSQQGSGNNTPTVNCSHGNSDPYQNISKLRGCEAHSTHILTASNEDTLRSLGINMTSGDLLTTTNLFNT